MLTKIIPLILLACKPEWFNFLPMSVHEEREEKSSSEKEEANSVNQETRYSRTRKGMINMRFGHSARNAF